MASGSAMTLSGPSRPPARGGKPAQLVVLLHGLGADGEDLIGLAPMLAQVLPQAVFVAPNAPFACDMGPYGYQWFSLLDRTPATVLAGVQAAASAIDGFLDAQLAAHGLTDDRLVLVGFSQGTMMSLHVALRRERAPAGVIGFSGRLIGADLLAREATVRPPVLLVHGDADEVVPVDSLAAAVQGLRAAGIPVESHVCAGLGHGIDEEGLLLAAQFLRRIVPAA